ncbi:MAG: TerB family tellurite resistance protein [Alphaproteobacteria bacterium]|nr:TerB family tellurite resistance protein [Alphaproteobacteria bacterium]
MDNRATISDAARQQTARTAGTVWLRARTGARRAHVSGLEELLKNAVTGEDDTLKFAEDDHRLAAAALLVHIISVDGVVDDAERAALSDVLKHHYQLTPEMTADLIKAATRRDNEAVDLYGFTSVLKRSLDIDERLKILEMMWQLVYADGIVHEFEDNTIWRVAELLGISSRDRLALRRKVAGDTDQDGGDELS